LKVETTTTEMVLKNPGNMSFFGFLPKFFRIEVVGSKVWIWLVTFSEAA